MTKKILITGGKGYLGGRLAKYFKGLGHSVTIASRDNSRSFHDFKVVKVNWSDRSTLVSVCRGQDIVVHAAGVNSLRCIENPNLAYNFNAIATSELIRAASDADVSKFIFLSTVHVYGSPLKGKITEDISALGTHPYATSNLAGENFVKSQWSSQRGHLDVCIIRLSNAVGPPIHRETDCWSLVCNDLTRQAVLSRKIKIKSSGEELRDFIAISQVCEVINKLAFIDTSFKAEIFNLSAEKSYSILQLAELIQLCCNKTLSFQPEIVILGGKNDSRESLTLNIKNAKLKKYGIRVRDELKKEIMDLVMFCNEHYC